MWEEFFVAFAQKALQSKMQHDWAKAAARNQNAMIEQQNKLLWEENDRRARAQRNLLERQKASARAAMGAMGVGGTGGSAAALLAGMSRETGQNLADDWARTAPHAKPLVRFDSSADALDRGLELAQFAANNFPRSK